MSRIRCSTSRVSLVRAWTLIVAALCALVQLGGLAHHLLVGHVVCPEHGELIHEDDLHAESTASRGAPDASSWTGDAVDAADHVLEDEHGHDHCVGGGGRVEGAPSVPRTFVVTSDVVSPSAPAVIATAPPRRAVGTPSSRRVWLFAPKCSPPSSATSADRHA